MFPVHSRNHDHYWFDTQYRTVRQPVFTPYLFGFQYIDVLRGMPRVQRSVVHLIPHWVSGWGLAGIALPAAFFPASTAGSNNNFAAVPSLGLGCGWAVAQSEAPAGTKLCVLTVRLPRRCSRLRFRRRFRFGWRGLFGGRFRTLLGSSGSGRLVRLILVGEDRSYPLERFQIGKICVESLVSSAYSASILALRAWSCPLIRLIS